MTRFLALTSVLALAVPARADTTVPTTIPAPEPPVAPPEAPVIDVQDLPPLPETGDDDAPTRATMFAASEAQEDVVVGAAKREQSLGNVASAVTVVSGDRLRRFGYRTVGEAVAGVAGAYLVDNRLSYALGIRGLQVPGDFNTRILVLVDGASINETWGAFAGIGFDSIVSIDEIARIEVIRGPVSSVYGTNAFFGIVNIVTRGAAEAPRAWGRASVGSINGVISSAGFSAGGVDRQVRGSVSVMNRVGESFQTLPDGSDVTGDGDGSKSFTAGVIGSYGGTFAQVRAFRYNRESPFAPYDVPPGARPYDQIDQQVLAEGGYTREVGERLVIGARAYANVYKFSDASPDDTGDALDTTGTARTLGVEVRGRYEIVTPDRAGITAGLETSSNHTRSTAFLESAPRELLADQPHDFALLGLYAELDAQPTPWLGLTAGLRGDIHSELDDNLSPRAAVFLAEPERYGLKLLYAEGFRNPSAFEAYFRDENDFVADPDALRAETIRSFEVVAWGKAAGVSGRLSAYYWDARDIIEAQPAPPPDDDKLQFQNVTRYVSRGLEGELSYRDSRGWYGFAGAGVSLVGTENASGLLVFGDVANAPVVTAGAGLSTPRLFGKSHVSLEALVIGPRPTRPDVMTGEAPEAPGWVGLNLAVYTPSIAGFDLTLGLRNLVGKRDLIPTPGDYDREGGERTVSRVPGEGREVYVKLGYSY